MQLELKKNLKKGSSRFKRLDANQADQIKRAACGNYRAILESAGVGSESLDARNKPCPWCGGVDRFSFTDRYGNGDSYCRHCGHHDGLDLLRLHKNCSFAEALRFVADYLHISFYESSSVVKTKHSEDLLEDKVQKLWSSAKPIINDDYAAQYLRSRGINGEFPDSLRFIDELSYTEKDNNQESWTESVYSALIAEISDADGKRINLQRIYLDKGRKADVKVAKKVLGKGLSGGAFRLGEVGEDGVLGLAEGVETALSASQLFKVPVWSVLSAFNFKNFTPPEGIKKIIVFADNDKNFVGQREAYAAAASLSQKYPGLSIEVRIPSAGGTDWNDELRAAGSPWCRLNHKTAKSGCTDFAK